MHQSNVYEGEFSFQCLRNNMAESIGVNLLKSVELLNYYEFLFWITHIQLEMYEVIHCFIMFIFSDDQN
jgi:hypothetical protein